RFRHANRRPLRSKTPWRETKKRPGRSPAVHNRIRWETSLRGGGQRGRMVRQRIEIGDHVGALAVVLNTGKAHCRSRNEALGVGDELVEVVDSPVAALALHARREVEAI